MDTRRSIAMAENPRHIVGIHKYCDRWCERCPFTDRCPQYDTQCDARDAVEDTDGTCVHDHPIVRAGDAYVGLVAAWFDTEHREVLARAQLLIARVDEVEGQSLVTEAVQVNQALQIIAHDSSSISAQLARALRSRLREGPSAGDVAEAVQNDSNGYAKVALISIDRSEVAWRVLAEWMDGSATALAVVETLSRLRTRLEREFPAARQFVRPGFDRASF